MNKMSTLKSSVSDYTNKNSNIRKLPVYYQNMRGINSKLNDIYNASALIDYSILAIILRKLG